MNIIGNRKIFYVFSGTLVLASVVSLAVFGLKLGLDFTGGTLAEIEFKESRPSNDEILKAIESLNLGSVSIQPSGERSAILRLKDIDEATHQKIVSTINAKWQMEEKRFESIGPTIGAELKRKAIFAIILAAALIILYIAWAFRKVSRPVSSWKYGVCAVLALIHDVTIPTGAFSLLGHFRGVEVDGLFITALLTILGFSVHDTIVVFDRVRENLKNAPKEKFEETVNASVNQTISRSINTSLTVLLVLLAIYFFGGETVKNFALALILGVSFGTYSSIFIASPLLVSWHLYSQKRSAVKKK